MKILLSQKDINVNALGLEGRTPLHNVVEDNQLEYAKMLLAHPDINVNILDDETCIPLRCAASFGY